MWELERESAESAPARAQDGAASARASNTPRLLAVVGTGRLGTALAAALDGEPPEGCRLAGPFGRGYNGAGVDAVLLCVPDVEIANAARLIAPGRLVGHCSGATSLEPLAPHEAFSFHPLLPVTAGHTRFAGAGAAVAGSTPRALAFAASLARALGMTAVEIDDPDRAAYHAAASIASNFLVVLEDAAERVAATAGVSRELLAPLVRATIENWANLGPELALTGPVARGDEATVSAQRAAVESRTPELLPLFDELLAATRGLATRAHAARDKEPALA